jgi:ribosome biogenesis GTPase
MRELGLWDRPNGLSRTFEDVESLARDCKFRNCRHVDEPGCAVQSAAENGILSPERIRSYRKLQLELNYLEAKMDPAKNTKRKSFWKKACKAQKKIYKNRGW